MATTDIHPEGGHGNDEAWDGYGYMTPTSAPPMHCTSYVDGDPDGCARCGEAQDLHPVRPPVDTIVIASFGGGQQILGIVTDRDHDSIGIRHLAERHDDGPWDTTLACDLFTVWDREQTSGVATVRTLEGTA
ncbi:MAG: hypothetical protein ACRDJP_01690 [Actinomycetota bacterium]